MADLFLEKCNNPQERLLITLRLQDVYFGVNINYKIGIENIEDPEFGGYFNKQHICYIHHRLRKY